ncbi:MAG: hypothetical protein KatS3mg055_3080 [Chloroflexus sp.]|nr:MAG: hypothetical protein KatS3mg055_3080 [Chloroflexus sp.]
MDDKLMTSGIAETAEKVRRRRRRVNGEASESTTNETVAVTTPPTTTTVIEEPVTMQGSGILEIVPDGHGFLRNPRLTPEHR